MNNNNRNTRQSRTPTISTNELVLARTLTTYFIEFAKYSKTLFTQNSLVTSKPSVIFFEKDSQDWVILDYTLAKEEDKLYLAALFANMQDEDQFSLTNGEYLDDVRSVEANLSATLLFKEFKNNMVFARVSSVTSKPTSVDLYSPSFFINTPQVSKAGTLTETDDTEIQALVFSNPRTAQPLIYLGYQPGDYIQIINPNSIHSNLQLEIKDVLFLNGKEVLFLNTDTITEENLLGQLTIVNLYIRSRISAMYNTYDNDEKTGLGCCVNSELNVALPQHTELQCALRGSGFVYSPGQCYGSLQSLIDPVSLSLAEDVNKAVYTDPIDQALQSVVDPEILKAFLDKKKITYLDTRGLIVAESNILATDYRTTAVPILQSSLEDIAAINAEQNVSGVAVLTHVPKYIVQSFSEIDGITLVADSPFYKILNIFYELYVTENEVIAKGVGGVSLLSLGISLNRNIITTLFEINLTEDTTERIIFSSTQAGLTPVVNFKDFGYDYIKLGNYHMITPVADNPKPLYIFTTKLKTSSNYIGGISETLTQSNVGYSAEKKRTTTIIDNSNFVFSSAQTQAAAVAALKSSVSL